MPENVKQYASALTRLAENWKQYKPRPTEDSHVREALPEEAVQVLHALHVTGAEYPQWSPGVTAEAKVSELIARYHTDKGLMQRAVRTGAVVRVSPRVIGKWADDFLKKPRAALRRHGRDEASDEQGKVALRFGLGGK